MLSLSFQAPASGSLPILSLRTHPVIIPETQLTLPWCEFPGFPFFWLLNSLFPDLLLSPQFLRFGNAVCYLIILLFQFHSDPIFHVFPYFFPTRTYFHRLIPDFPNIFPSFLFPPCFCLPLFLADGMLSGIPALPVPILPFLPKCCSKHIFKLLIPEFQPRLESFLICFFPLGVSHLLFPP